MPAKTTPESQERALLIRNAIAVIGMDYPNPRDNAFRESIIPRVIAEIPKLDISQLTRLHEASCAAKSDLTHVVDLRTECRKALAKIYDLPTTRQKI
jgi:hypothetical protein